MMLTVALASKVSGLFFVVSSALATPPTAVNPAIADQFVQVCTEQLTLNEGQSTRLREYLMQEINYLAVQRANHTPAEVAELLPTEREQLQHVASRLMSPTQLRGFRELEATPQMKEYLRQMELE